MPLPGGGTTRIKRDQSLSSNPTSRSISIQWAMVHFGGMGSPNIYIIQYGEAIARRRKEDRHLGIASRGTRER